MDLGRIILVRARRLAALGRSGLVSMLVSVRVFGSWPLVGLWTILLTLICHGQLGRYVTTSIDQPLLFQARQLLHRDPVLDPHLKIFSYDDTSVDRLQRTDLTIDDWATVLTALAARAPREIVVDKVFSIIFDPLGQKSEALARLRAIKVPVVVGAFAVENAKQTRHPLNLDAADYQLQNMLRSPNDRAPNLPDYLGWHVYGPAPELQGIFRSAGSLLYNDTGTVSAILQPTQTTVVPHIGIILEDRRFENGELYVNGTHVPLDAHGQLLVDFSQPDTYYERHTRLGTALASARVNEPIEEVDPGDTVLVLPEMYTGSTDMKSTPVGQMPGGFIPAAVLNSVMTKHWLTWAPQVELQGFLLCLLGGFWGYYRRSRGFWLGQLAMIGIILVLDIYLFAFASVATPVAWHLSAFGVSAVIIFAGRGTGREDEARRIADELNDAAEMAKAFRPDQAPNWDFCQIATLHRPLTKSSGDWYAFQADPVGRFSHFILCDVTGHGVQGALIVSICKTVLQIRMRDHPETVGTREFLVGYAEALSGMLYYHGKGHHLLTMLGISMEPDAGVAHFLSAGHPSPLIVSRDSRNQPLIRQLSLRTTLLGLLPDYRASLRTVSLAPGDEIIAHTDGLPVNRHLRLVRQFYESEMSPHLTSSPQLLLDQVWAAESAKTGRKLADDVSIVWFKILRSSYSSRDRREGDSIPSDSHGHSNSYAKAKRDRSA